MNREKIEKIERLRSYIAYLVKSTLSGECNAESYEDILSLFNKKLQKYESILDIPRIEAEIEENKKEVNRNENTYNRYNELKNRYTNPFGLYNSSEEYISKKIVDLIKRQIELRGKISNINDIMKIDNYVGYPLGEMSDPMLKITKNGYLMRLEEKKSLIEKKIKYYSNLYSNIMRSSIRCGQLPTVFDMNTLIMSIASHDREYLQFLLSSKGLLKGKVIEEEKEMPIDSMTDEKLIEVIVIDEILSAELFNDKRYAGFFIEETRSAMKPEELNDIRKIIKEKLKKHPQNEVKEIKEESETDILMKQIVEYAIIGNIGNMNQRLSYLKNKDKNMYKRLKELMKNEYNMMISGIKQEISDTIYKDKVELGKKNQDLELRIKMLRDTNKSQIEIRNEYAYMENIQKKVDKFNIEIEQLKKECIEDDIQEIYKNIGEILKNIVSCTDNREQKRMIEEYKKLMLDINKKLEGTKYGFMDIRNIQKLIYNINSGEYIKLLSVFNIQHIVQLFFPDVIMKVDSDVLRKKHRKAHCLSCGM